MAARHASGAPEILSKVGFEKSKIGAGDKETGYQIKESSLSSLMGSACLCFLVMGLMVVSMVFDIHFEKKTIHRQLRQEEHHAASKLAQVQMELWSEFHSDIQESHEAQALVKNMNASYGTLQGKIKASVNELSAELSLNPVKAEKFADKLLHLVADMQQDNVKHAKGLVSHLVAAGKRSQKLEKRVDKEMLTEAKEEKKAMLEDAKEGINAALPLQEHEHTKPLSEDAKRREEDEDDPLKEMLTGFFFTFDDFEREFQGEARKKMVDGNHVYESIKALYVKTQADEPPAEEDLQAELDKIDLSSVGAGLGSGRALPVFDLIEELSLIPKIPYKDIRKLEKQWKKGDLDSVAVFEQLQELHEKHQVPSGWLQLGVDSEEKEEEKEEDSDDEQKIQEAGGAGEPQED